VRSPAERPVVVVIGGPNGAGKSTSAGLLLPDALGIRQFVNADTIAAGLSAFAPESVAFEAGRIMLRRLQALAERRQTFAFETTLASRSFAPFLKRLKSDGYSVRIAYLWLFSPELSIRRVAERVARGGHFVPDETVRRRYQRGLTNFQELYSPLADSWVVCDNSRSALRPIAMSSREGSVWALDPEDSREGEWPLPADELVFGRHDDFFTPYALECMQRAVALAVAEHHRVGNSVYVWQDGGMVRSYPDGSFQPVEPDAAASPSPAE